MLNNLNWEGIGKNSDPASLSHLLASATALFKLKNETFMFLSNISKIDMADSDEDRKPNTTPELTFTAKVHEIVLQKWDESKNLLNTYSQKFVDLREEIKSIITNSGHCDPADLYPYLEKGNQDQIVILNTIWGWMYPNGRENHIVFGSSNNTVKNQNSTTELPNMTSDSKVIETEAPKNDMITVDLKIHDTQINPKQNPMPKETLGHTTKSKTKSNA